MSSSTPRLDNQTYYDTFAPWYERERGHGYHALIDDLQIELLQDACQGREVLEIGCGTGVLLQRIERLSRRAVGIDLSAGMLEQARARNLSVLQASAENLPFADESFDVVFSFKVLAHVEAIEQAVAEATRVLRPGGRAFLEFYNRLSLRNLAKQLAGPGNIASNEDESAVFTRWDWPWECAKYFPANMQLRAPHGVRVFTPAASFHKMPVVGAALQHMERWAMHRQPWSTMGGFYVIEAVKGR